MVINEEIKFNGLDHLPVVIPQQVIVKFRELYREDVDGSKDALLLLLSINQWNLMGIDWDNVTVTEELGFNDDYLHELVDFLIDLGFIKV